MSTVIPGGLAASYSQKQAQKPATSRAVPGTLVLRDSVGRINAGSVGISNNNPQTPLHNSKAVDSAAAHPFRAGILTEDEGSGISGRIGIRSANAIGEAPYVVFYRSRGTLASPAAVQSNDTLGGVVASTYNGSAWSGGGVGGSMLFGASENWTTSANGSHITFSTTPNGSTGSQERLRIKANGQVRFVPLSADPTGAEDGDVYYNSSTNRLRVRAAGNWVDLH